MFSDFVGTLSFFEIKIDDELSSVPLEHSCLSELFASWQVLSVTANIWIGILVLRDFDIEDSSGLHSRGVLDGFLRYAGYMKLKVEAFII